MWFITTLIFYWPLRSIHKQLFSMYITFKLCCDCLLEMVCYQLRPISVLLTQLYITYKLVFGVNTTLL